MGIRTNVYLALGAALYEIKDENENRLFQTVDLWNNQWQYLESEKPFDFPAVFIQFEKIEWQQLSGGRQMGEILFVLHIGYKNTLSTRYRPDMDLKPFAGLDYPDVIHNAIIGLNNDFISGVTRTGSAHDHDHDQINAQMEKYKAVIYDCSGEKQLTRKPVKPEFGI